VWIKTNDIKTRENVACVLLNHATFSIQAAKRWVRDHGYRIPKQGHQIFVSNRYFHFHQRNPRKKPGYHYRFIQPRQDVRLLIATPEDKPKKKKRRNKRKGKRRERHKRHRQGRKRKQH
jgi:hypothetical protein